MDYEELIEKREKLQVEMAAIEKQIMKFGDPAREILEFLNSKTGNHYRPVQSNLAMIRARLKEGFTPDEMRQVIARKCREWRNDDFMSKYLRPKTLFNATNFANYSGELQ